MTYRPIPCILLALSLLALAACGGSDSSGSGSFADGGISGTGTGTVTGYGSIIINGDRRFEIASNTSILLDGNPISEATLQGLGSGFVARVDVGDDVNQDLTAGTAVNILVEHRVKGPVTSTAPFEVLGQPVFTTGDTVLNNLSDPAQLGVGNMVEVSGYAGSGNVIQATRLEYEAGGLPIWKLVGPVTALGTGTLFIGAQEVDIGSVSPRNCGAGPIVGDLVEVAANNDPGFTPGGVLSTVTHLECRAPGLEIPEGVTGGTLRAEVEGIVSAVSGTPPNAFTVNGQEVVTTVATVFEGGEAVDVDLGVILEAEGTLDVTSGVLTAKRVRFRSARVRLEAPVESVTAGSSLTTMGLTVVMTSLTEEEAVTATVDQVEVRGFLDSDGRIFATRIKHRGEANASQVRLRGPVSAIAGDPIFSVLDIQVDTTETGAFLDAADAEILRPAFFSALAVGSQVSVEDGAYSGTISNPAVVSLED